MADPDPVDKPVTLRVLLDLGQIDGDTATAELRRAEALYDQAHELAKQTGAAVWVDGIEALA